MEMNELKQSLPQCPRCGRHCPIDATSCPRGGELAQKLLNGEITPEQAAQEKRERAEGEGRQHHGHHHHGDHGNHGTQEN